MTWDATTSCLSRVSRPTPHVSIVMPFLNAGAFIANAVDSVLQQTFTDWELLLVDDGSCDDSTAIARTYAERYPDRIFYHGNQSNRGASAARNLGIQKARGELLALLDADDLWLPGHLQNLVPLFEAVPQAGSVFTSTFYWYSWNAAVAEADFIEPLGLTENTLLPAAELMVRFWSGRASIPCTCALLLRRELADRIGGFEEKFRLVFTDQSFYTKLFIAAPTYYAAGCWNWYRQHAASSVARINAAGGLQKARLDYLRWAADYLTGLDLLATSAGRALVRELWWSERPSLWRARDVFRAHRRRLRSVVQRGAFA